MLAALMAGCVGGADPSSLQSGQANGEHYGPHLFLTSHARNTAIRPLATGNLTYRGGPVLQHVSVVTVFWGNGVQFTSQLDSFYGTVTNSAYYDWLSEYDTTNPTQVIGRGSFNTSFHFTNGATGTIDDSQISASLGTLIDNGSVPAPTANTLYAIHFAPGITITQGGSASCQVFCAYHNSFSHNGTNVYYSVVPDQGGSCAGGCGADPSLLNNTTSVSSHELVEATTDADVGQNNLAWYDDTNGEIGDICNAQQGSICGFTVQTEWSNQAGACIVKKSASDNCGTVTPPNDFSIAASPSSATVTAGGSTSYSISTAVTSGSAQTITLAASGLPSGATASFSPTSITAGGSATLSVSTTASTPSGTYSVTITGTGSAATHTAAVTLVVTGGTTGGGITNGDFETGNLSGWTSAGTTSISTTAHGGRFAAQVGGTSPTNGDSSIAQTFTAPSSGGTLSFFYLVNCPDTLTYDWATAMLRDNTSGTTTTVLAKTCSNTGAWTHASSALTGGHSYTLTLISHDDNYPGDATFTLYDDVAIAGSTPPPPSGITNGTFETGDLGGWTTAGTTSVSTTAHSGSGAAEVGGTSPTNGDSSIAQTFTAPAGSSSLSFWYLVNCPDTLTYDWATATLRDNTSGTTTTVLAKTCNTANVWAHVTSPITAGHSYTLTLISHDDDFASDPTYTLYDDVATQ
jgi:hypothetical protein